MNILRNRILGRLMLCLTIAAWTVSSVIVFSNRANTEFAWLVALSVAGLFSSVLAAFAIARTRGALIGLLTTFFCCSTPFIIGLVLVRPGWESELNLGAAALLYFGLYLQPVGALIAAITLFVDWVLSLQSTD